MGGRSLGRRSSALRLQAASLQRRTCRRTVRMSIRFLLLSSGLRLTFPTGVQQDFYRP